MHEFTVVESVDNIHGICLLISFVVGFLDVATGGSVVMSHRQTHHRTIGKGEGTLHKSFAVCASAHHDTAVPILDCTGGNFG